MKDAPEIAPEVRGLIEEIVANPRSSLRLVPKRALLPWIEKGERASVRELSSDAAVRHLLAAHREAVARLLREAAHIAYWKAPVMSYKPVGPDGKSYLPAQAEGCWRARAQSRVEVSTHADEGVQLLKDCIDEIRPERGIQLARASLSLSRDEFASFTLAEFSKEKQPRVSLRIFSRIGQPVNGLPLRWMALGGSGCCYCYLSEFEQALHSYLRASAGWPRAWFSVFNLALLLQRPELALEAAREIEARWPSKSFEVDDAKGLLSAWARGLRKDMFLSIRATVARLGDQLPEAANTIGQAYA